MSENAQVQVIMLSNGNRAKPIRDTYVCSVCGSIVRSEYWLIDAAGWQAEHCGVAMPLLARGWPDVKQVTSGLFEVKLARDELPWQDRLVSWFRSVVRGA